MMNMSHKTRALLSYLPIGINFIYEGAYLFSREVRNPLYGDFRNISPVYSIRSFILFLLVNIPAVFSICMIIWNFIFMQILEAKDKKNGTRLYKSIFDETYDENVRGSLLFSVTLGLGMLLLSMFFLFFTKLFPFTVHTIFLLVIIIIGFSLLGFGINFFIRETKLTVFSEAEGV